VPSGLSVVRPGERIRFALPAAIRTGEVPVSLSVAKICKGGLPSVMPFLAGRSWTVHLRPGGYVATLSFAWQGKATLINESGVVGLLVSRSKSLGVIYSPRCG
jgi:hypothetical protein